MRHAPRPFPLPAVVAAALALALAAPGPAGAQGRFRRTPPIPDSFREIKLPDIESFPLPNGLTVAVTRRPGSPLVTIQVVIMAGESDSRQDLPYVASLTARMIGRGTNTMSSDDMERLIESIGGDFSAMVFMDYTVLTLHVLLEQLDRALDILRLMIVIPEFHEQDLATVRRNFFYDLQAREKDPESVGRRQLERVLFENHPYQTATQGKSRVSYITVKDIRAFFNKFYAPNNAVLVVSGDVDGATVARKVGRLLGPWARRDVVKTALPPPPANDKKRVCFVDFPAAEDAVIYIGNLVMAPRSPDYYPFLVLNQVLGGTMNSRLFMNLRETKGVAYTAFSEVAFYRTCGVFWAKARVMPEAIRAAVGEIIREFQAFPSEKIEPAEIEEAKSFLIGQLPLRFETLEKYGDQLARVLALGLDAGHWGRASDNLMQVNVEEVPAVARKYLAANPVVVIVGKKEWAGEALKDFGAVEMYDLSGALQAILRQGVEK
jgi:zinc protease